MDYLAKAPTLMAGVGKRVAFTVIFFCVYLNSGLSHPVIPQTLAIDLCATALLLIIPMVVVNGDCRSVLRCSDFNITLY